MRLFNYLKQIDEEGEGGTSGVGTGELGAGATTTAKIAQYPQRLKLGITKREATKNWKKKKKKEEDEE